jgi:rhodanese-related sulfurtransferase|nr:rhodanese-like domain-containing protein [Candidatus Krumholzibacteria bacterium]
MMAYPPFSPAGQAAPWPTAWKQAAFIMLLTVVLTAGSWMMRTPRLPLQADPTVYELELSAPVVEIAQARLLFDEGAHLFIDTRAGDPTDRPTIAGAFVIREQNFDDDLLALFDDLFPEDPVIVFGSGNMVGASNVAGRLLGRGFTDVQILRGGMAGWEKDGGLLGSAYLPPDFVADTAEDSP